MYVDDYGILVIPLDGVVTVLFWGFLALIALSAALHRR